jgi:F-type H+-transporting ATPase subunit alpha
MFRNALRQSSRSAVGAIAATGRVRVATPALAAVTKQTRSYASADKASPTEVSSILEQRIRGVQEEAGLAETGRVLSVGYVATIFHSSNLQQQIANSHQ